MELFYRFYVYLAFAGVFVWCADVRTKREANGLHPGNWDSCKQGAAVPSTRKDTTGQIMLLRNYFATAGIDAYLIPSEDAHNSEYVSHYDQRRGYVSGFYGSAGFVVVTIYKQALWTDGRYFLEAESSLDCNWILMRQQEQGVPTMLEWVKSELNATQRLGASPFLLNHDDWKYYAEKLAMDDIELKAVYPDLIDYFWTTGNGRPAQPNTPINALPMEFAGRSWQDKVTDVRDVMEEKGVDMLVVTKLDETAWLFNLRASDIPYNPFFMSYAIVEPDRVRLYVLDHVKKLSANPTDPATNITMAAHLNTDMSGSCQSQTGDCVEVKPYSETTVLEDVREAAGVRKRVLVSSSCNFAIYNRIPEAKVIEDHSPIAMFKVVKNSIEVNGMKKSHIRDAVALISFMAKLEAEVKAGQKWTEVSAAKELAKYRSQQKYNRGLSFQAISSFGPNGAVIHYRPSNATNKQITTDSLYLLDSGGQYLDGTTDVTRTFHFGIPTDYQKECYTRVLMGHINLFQTVFPEGTQGRDIDAQARIPLWDIGLVYRHGTGHGIGMYLSVHEGPIYFRAREILRPHNFISDEPGYYEDNEFGIRIENIVMVTNTSTKYNFPGYRFLTFEHITLVPYEPKLINFEELDEHQISYLNEYNKLCRDLIGPELQRQGQQAGFDWLMKNTEPIEMESEPSKPTSGSFAIHSSPIYTIATYIVLFYISSLIASSVQDL